MQAPMKQKPVVLTWTLKAYNQWRICVFKLTSSFFLKDCLKPERHPQTGFCKDWNFTEQAVDFYEAFWASIVYSC